MYAKGSLIECWNSINGGIKGLGYPRAAVLAITPFYYVSIM